MRGSNLYPASSGDEQLGPIESAQKAVHFIGMLRRAQDITGSEMRGPIAEVIPIMSNTSANGNASGAGAPGWARYFAEADNDYTGLSLTHEQRQDLLDNHGRV